jgi:hypothetical protein
MRLPIQNAMVSKELRPLLLPWCCTVALGGLFALKPLVEGQQLFPGGLVPYGFLAGLALVCSMSFGEEFQHRTVALLLSQPLPRSRVWRQKTVTIGTLVVLAVVFECAWLAGVSAWYRGEEIPDAVRDTFTGQDLLLAAVFLVATVCSCGYWALVAQSTIGGLVFTVSGQLLSALAVGLVVERASHGTELFASSTTFPALLVGGLLYSGLFLWLGRRKFLQFEVKGYQAGSTGGLKINWLRGSVARLGLTSTPDRKFLNLVRREVHLLKPAFQLAGVFVLTWFGILGLRLVKPGDPISWLFDWLACLYAPLTALLGGCVTLGEEKALAIVDTQLTLPTSRTVQWAIKFLSCFCITSILIIGLPMLLFWFTGCFLDLNQSGLVGPDRGLLGLACFCGVVFGLAFWASTQMQNAVQATLLVVVTGLVFFSCAVFGSWAGQPGLGLLFRPLVSIMCELHFSPDTMAGWVGSTEKVGWVTGILVLLILLYQSFRRFGRPAQTRRKLAKDVLLMAVPILVGSFLAFDLTKASLSFGYSEPVQELRSAVQAIAASDPEEATGKVRVVRPEALLGRVSEQTLHWLKGSQVSYQVITLRWPKESGVGHQLSKEDRNSYVGSVRFPDGVTYSFDAGMQ